jgi:hypothetical protein
MAYHQIVHSYQEPPGFIFVFVCVHVYVYVYVCPPKFTKCQLFEKSN